MKYKLIFILITFLISCNNYNLGKDYYYLPDDEAEDIGFPDGAIIYKSERKNVFNKIIVFANVTDCVSNDDYIIATQKPNEQIIKKKLVNDLEFWNKYFIETKKDSVIEFPHKNLSLNSINNVFKNNGNQANLIADSIIKNEKYYKKLFLNKINYWIIYVPKDSLLGPFTMKEYLEKRNEMKIPNYLKLK